MANGKHKKQWFKGSEKEYRVNSYGFWISTDEAVDLQQFDHLEIYRLLKDIPSEEKPQTAKGGKHEQP